MQIICPKCQFARTIPDEKIPAAAEMATCPKCANKFKFRNLSGAQAGDSGDARLASGHETPSAPPKAPPHPTSSHIPPGTMAAPPPGPPSSSGVQTDKPQGDIWDHIASMGTDEPRREAAPGPAPRKGYERKPPPADAMTIPWENLDTFGFFPALTLTTKYVLLTPTRFFQSMPVDGTIGKPLAYYLLIGMFSSLVQYVWSSVANIILTSMGLAEGMEGNPLFALSGLAGAGSFFMLVVYPLLFTVAIFVSAAVNHVFLMLFQAASAGFNGTFRAAAYGYAPYIIGVIPIVGPVVAMFWCLVTTIIAYKTVHQTTYPRVFCALFIPIAVLVLGVILLAGAVAFMVKS